MCYSPSSTQALLAQELAAHAVTKDALADLQIAHAKLSTTTARLQVDVTRLQKERDYLMRKAVGFTSSSSISAAVALRIEGLQNQVEQLQALAPSVTVSAAMRDNEMLKEEMKELKNRMKEMEGKVVCGQGKGAEMANDKNSEVHVEPTADASTSSGAADEYMEDVDEAGGEVGMAVVNKGEHGEE